MFETDRLILRAVRESDYDNLLRLCDDAAVQRFISPNYLVPLGPKFIDDMLKKQVESALIFVIVTHKETGDWMGFCVMAMGNAKNRDAEMGIALSQEYQNNGYGTEVIKFMINHVFTALGLHRVSLAVFECNERAAAVYKKIGFVEEGRSREANWVDGKWEAFIKMGILETEWAALAGRSALQS